MTKKWEHDNIKFHPKNWSMTKKLEHDKKIGSMTNLLMHVLPFYLSCSNILSTFPNIRLKTSFVAVLKRSPSRFLLFQRSKYRQFLSCSNIFVMLQIFLSCSNFIYHAPTFSSVFCEKFWSMIKKIGA